jgi:hypothetical protein
MELLPNNNQPNKQNNNLTDKTKQLKLFFIPSEENNYYPHSLNPKRLFFYGVVALIIKLIVIAIIVLYPLGAWLTPDILTNESKKIIELTNQIRLSNGISPLVENNSLDNSANQKVQDMLINQYFAHIGPDQTGLIKWLSKNNYKYTNAGENLAMGFMTAEDVVNAWVKSPTHYANLIDSSYQQIGVAMASGYFNNVDTTLAAQHFAQPKTIKQNEDALETTINNSTSKQTAITIVPAGANINEIALNKETAITMLSEPTNNQLPTMAYEPIIVSPKNNSRVNSRDLMFIIFTPEKTHLSFKVNDTWQAPITEEDGQYYQASLLLAEGQNRIRVIATNSQNISLRSKEVIVFVDSQTPSYDRLQTYVKLTSPVGQKQTVMEAQITSPESLASAEVTVGNYHLNLLSTADNKTWRGSLIIYDRYARDFFNPVILPTAKFTDLAGNTTVVDIDWKEIQPIRSSFLDQYLFIKAQENSSAKPIIGFANNYYRIMLGLIIIALQLNIFIKIKHQQPVAIINAVAVIGLLIWLLLI